MIIELEARGLNRLAAQLVTGIAAVMKSKAMNEFKNSIAMKDQSADKEEQTGIKPLTKKRSRVLIKGGGSLPPPSPLWTIEDDGEHD